MPPSSDGKPVSVNLSEFIQAGVERVYPGRWKGIGEGFGTAIEVDGQGVLLVHPEDGPFLHFAGGVLSGLEFSEELVRHLGNVNCEIPFGALTLSEGQPGHWMIGYGFKIAKTWLDPTSRSGPQLVLDLLDFVPGYIDRQVLEIQPKFSGRRWGVGDSWWFTLMDHY
jgi:hypothetical protein